MGNLNGDLYQLMLINMSDAELREEYLRCTSSKKTYNSKMEYVMAGLMEERIEVIVRYVKTLELLNVE